MVNFHHFPNIEGAIKNKKWFIYPQHGHKMLVMIFQGLSFTLLLGYFLSCYMQYTTYLNNKCISHEATYLNQLTRWEFNHAYPTTIDDMVCVINNIWV
jgi:hypothetical protein